MDKKLKVVKLSGRFVRQDDKRAIDRVNQATLSGQMSVKVARATAEKIDAIRRTMGLEVA